MTRIARAPQPVTCPNCGRVAEGAPHYCPTCGLDYWRVAAGAAPTPIDSRRASVAVAQRGPGRPAILVALGFAGLVAAGIGTAIFAGGAFQPDEPLIANTRPSRGPHDFIIERFYGAARSPFANYRYVSTAVARQVSPVASEHAIVESVVVHGDDWLSRRTYAVEGEPTEDTLAVVDGVVYAQLGTDAEWLVGETVGEDRPGSPFFRITTVGEISYVDSELGADGVVLHHLLVTKWLGASGTDARMLGMGQLVDRAGSLEIWVTEDGIPVRARSVSTFGLSEGGDTDRFSVEATMTFEAWGEVDPIVRPDTPVSEPAAGGGDTGRA
jgi:hypothetical protein